MRLNVAVECPCSCIVRHESDGRPSVWKQNNRVLQGRIAEIELAKVLAWIERSVAIGENPEIVAMEVPWMDVAAVGHQNVGVLQNEIDGGVEIEGVDGIPCDRVGVGGGSHYVVAVRRICFRGWSMVEGVIVTLITYAPAQSIETAQKSLFIEMGSLEVDTPTLHFTSTRRGGWKLKRGGEVGG
jgi:hypothetical protein